MMTLELNEQERQALIELLERKSPLCVTKSIIRMTTSTGNSSKPESK